MTNQPNHYDLNGPSTRVTWLPKGAGGPVKVGGPKPGAPVLHYSNGSVDVSASGNDLTIARSPAGTFVTAIIKKIEVGPGSTLSFALLIPDANVAAHQSTAIHTVGVLSLHREVSQLGPGQLETYTTIPLTGTAASVVLPD